MTINTKYAPLAHITQPLSHMTSNNALTNTAFQKEHRAPAAALNEIMVIVRQLIAELSQNMQSNHSLSGNTVALPPVPNMANESQASQNTPVNQFGLARNVQPLINQNTIHSQSGPIQVAPRQLMNQPSEGSQFRLPQAPQKLMSEVSNTTNSIFNIDMPSLGNNAAFGAGNTPQVANNSIFGNIGMPSLASNSLTVPTQIQSNEQQGNAAQQANIMQQASNTDSIFGNIGMPSLASNSLTVPTQIQSNDQQGNAAQQANIMQQASNTNSIFGNIGMPTLGSANLQTDSQLAFDNNSLLLDVGNIPTLQGMIGDNGQAENKNNTVSHTFVKSPSRSHWTS